MNGRVIETPAWPGTYGDEAKPRMGFFTDTSVCIGCKACEVACKEWNEVPAESLGFTGESYDNSGDLGATGNLWRRRRRRASATCARGAGDGDGTLRSGRR